MSDHKPEPSKQPQPSATQPNRTGFQGYEVNPPHAQQFARAIGGLLANFGYLEFISKAWLNLVSTDQKLVERLDHIPLRQRIHLIQGLIADGRVPEPHGAKATQLWRRVAELSEIRNQVSHNPILFGRRGVTGENPRDFAGVLDRRKNVKNAEHPGLLTATEIEQAGNEVMRLVQELDALGQTIDERGP
jgi:hypothetical protein